MKKSKFSESQIVAILKEADAGILVKDICRKHGISSPTYYSWKSKYGGMEASDLKRTKELESENAKLKRMYADLALDRYAQQFEAMGWKIESQTDSNRFLIRGENEAVDIATYPMNGWDVSKLDPNNRRDEFLTVLHLRLFTALPQREGC